MWPISDYHKNWKWSFPNRTCLQTQVQGTNKCYQTCPHFSTPAWSETMTPLGKLHVAPETDYYSAHHWIACVQEELLFSGFQRLGGVLRRKNGRRVTRTRQSCKLCQSLALGGGDFIWWTLSGTSVPRARAMSESSESAGALGTLFFYVLFVHPVCSWILAPKRFRKDRAIVYAILFLATIAFGKMVSDGDATRHVLPFMMRGG